MGARESALTGLRAVPCPPDVDPIDLAVLAYEDSRRDGGRAAMRAAFHAAGVDRMAERLEEQDAELAELRALRDTVTAAIAARSAA